MNTDKHGRVEVLKRDALMRFLVHALSTLQRFNVLTLCALLFAITARANPAFILTPAVQSGTGSNEIYFAAALTNANPTTNFYLNDLQLSFSGAATNYLSADTNAFFANVPGILLTNETYTGVVFGVAINPSTPPGNYTGTATLLGGTNIFATDFLANQTFQVLLLPAILNLAAAGTNCVLSWPSPPAGFVLEENEDLITTNWTAVTNAPALSNGWNRVMLPMTGINCFYRLTYP